MIEANPRLWGPMQFALDNGVDFFAAMMRDLGFEPTQSSEQDGSASHYFWSGGFAKQGLPVSYHNYSGEQFAQQYSGIRVCDIFLREDTLRLFYHETKMACDNE
jgi:hypothetical protein